MSRAQKASTKKRASKKKTSTRSRPASSKGTRKTSKKPRKTAKKAVKKTTKAKPAKKARKPAKRPAKKAAKRPAKKPAKRAAGKAAKKKTGKKAKNPATPTPAGAPVLLEVKQAPRSFQRYYDTWRRRLIQLRRRLLGETTQLEEEALRAHEDEVSVDHMADYGSDSYEQEFTLSLIESKSEALREVDEALRRIQEGTYGLCEECETVIPKGRLEVIPHAAYCITCKSAMESEAF